MNAVVKSLFHRPRHSRVNVQIRVDVIRNFKTRTPRRFRGCGFFLFRQLAKDGRYFMRTIKVVIIVIATFFRITIEPLEYVADRNRQEGLRYGALFGKV